MAAVTVDIKNVSSPEGAVHGRMAKQFAVRSELRYRRKLIYVTAGGVGKLRQNASDKQTLQRDF